MKCFYAWLLFTVLALSCFSQSINNDSAWVRNNYVKKEVYIAMRDGVRLLTSMYIPKDSAEKHPLLLTRTPFSCGPYGGRFDEIWNNYKLAYLQEKYIIVNQDVRGKFMSEGLFEDVRPYIHHKNLTEKRMSQPMHSIRLTGSSKIFPATMARWAYSAFPIMAFMLRRLPSAAILL